MKTALLLFLAASSSSWAVDSSKGGLLQTLAEREMHFVASAPKVALAPVPRIPESDVVAIISQQKAVDLEDMLLAAREDTSACEDLLREAKVDGKPYTRALIYMALHDCSVLGARELLAFRIPPPSDFSPRIRALAYTGSAFAYPSVHTTNLHVALRILEACGARPNVSLKSFADRVTRRRIIAGIEWPTAVAGGDSLAERYLKLMRQSPRFEMHLSLARNEWR